MWKRLRLFVGHRARFTNQNIAIYIIEERLKTVWIHNKTNQGEIAIRMGDLNIFAKYRTHSWPL